MSAGFLPPTIRAVFFDAVGTLIDPVPSAADAYHLIGQAHGLAIDRAVIAERFHAAFRDQEEFDGRQEWRVDEERERQRWRRIIEAVFLNERVADALFETLWAHFADPASWRVAAGASEVLRALAGLGLTIGIASNFDARLHRLIDGLPALAPVGPRVISSEVGWRKPSPRFFDAVARAAGCEPSEIAFIGDRRDLDYDGPAAAGMHAVLLDDSATESSGVRRIRTLAQLLV